MLPLAIAVSVADTRSVMPPIALTRDGHVNYSTDAGPAFSPGVATELGPNGATVWSFDGRTGGIAFPDQPSLATARSITVAAWVKLRGPSGSAGQIVFRGDDRPGRDPFSLVVWPDGTLHFGIEDGKHYTNIGATLPEGVWTHVTASIDDKTGKLSMWLNGTLVAQSQTTVRPTVPLDPSAVPGIGIGNVQNPRWGMHHQPLNGWLADVRIYPFAVTPNLAGYSPRGFVEPSFQRGEG